MFLLPFRERQTFGDPWVRRFLEVKHNICLIFVSNSSTHSNSALPYHFRDNFGMEGYIFNQAISVDFLIGTVSPFYPLKTDRHATVEVCFVSSAKSVTNRLYSGRNAV